MVKITRLIGNRYRELGQIGKGGMGTIYKVATADGAVYAAKELDSSTTSPEHVEEYKLRFEREAHNLGVLNKRSTPNIPYFVELFQESGSGRYYIIMNYIEGQTIENSLRKEGRTTEQTAVYWGYNISRTLSFMHTIDPVILHRDIKPSNIMLTPDGRIVVVDFGISQKYGDKEIAMGTPDYAPREQHKMGSGTTPKSDVYSTGVTLYKALVSELPMSLNAAEQKEQLKRRRPSLSNEMADIITRCLEDEQSLRPSSSQLHDAFAEMNKPRKIISLSSPPSPTKSRSDSVLFIM